MADDTEAVQVSKEQDPETRFAALFQKAKGRRWVVDRLGKLAAIGDAAGASLEDTVDVMEKYMKEPEDWNFALQHKTLLCRALELPDEALNSPLTVGSILDFTGSLQSVSSDAMDIVRDPKVWKLIKLRGRGGARETEQIISEVWAEKLGVPKDTAFRLTLKQLSDGVVGLQQRGLEGAVSRPEFWDDFLKSPNKGATFEKWQGKLGEEGRIADARRDRELRQAMIDLGRAMAKRDKEWEELRRLREQDRHRRIVEEMKKKKKKKRKRRKAKVAVGPISIARRVATPWGSNYVLRAYEDGTTELIRIEEDGTSVIVLSGRYAYSVSETPGGMLHVVPVLGRETTHRPGRPTGRRVATPLDQSSGAPRGPAGKDQ